MKHETRKLLLSLETVAAMVYQQSSQFGRTNWCYNDTREWLRKEINAARKKLGVPPLCCWKDGFPNYEYHKRTG